MTQTDRNSGSSSFMLALEEWEKRKKDIIAGKAKLRKPKKPKHKEHFKLLCISPAKDSDDTKMTFYTNI